MLYSCTLVRTHTLVIRSLCNLKLECYFVITGMYWAWDFHLKRSKSVNGDFCFCFCFVCFKTLYTSVFRMQKSKLFETLNEKMCSRRDEFYAISEVYYSYMVYSEREVPAALINKIRVIVRFYLWTVQFAVITSYFLFSVFCSSEGSLQLTHKVIRRVLV